MKQQMLFSGLLAFLTTGLFLTPTPAEATFRRIPATSCYLSGDWGGDYQVGAEERGGLSTVVIQRGLQPEGGKGNISNNSGTGRTRQLVCPVIDDSSLSHSSIGFMAIDGRDDRADKSISAIACVAQTQGDPFDVCGSFTYTSNGAGGSQVESTAFTGGFFLTVDRFALNHPTFAGGYANVILNLPSSAFGTWISGMYYQN